MASGVFKQMGIFGWEKLEAIILSGILARQSILLKGEHGTDKTEASEKITKGILGKSSNFTSFDTPLIRIDDLLGYPNPKSLSDGVISFIHTPNNIWEANSCNFDEINRANIFTQSKVMEIINHRSIMGKKLKQLKIVFATCNPPGVYQSGFLDHANASRFMTVEVPSIHSLKDGDLKNVFIKKKKINNEKNSIYGIFSKYKTASFSKHDKEKISNVVIKISKEIRKIKGIKESVIFSTRQAKQLYKAILAYTFLNRNFKKDIIFNSEILTNLVMSFIPEASGIIKREADVLEVLSCVSSCILSFETDDPIISAEKLEELLCCEIDDTLVWGQKVSAMLEIEENKSMIKTCIKKIKKMTRKNKIEKTQSKYLINECNSRIIMLEVKDKKEIFSPKNIIDIQTKI